VAIVELVLGILLACVGGAAYAYFVCTIGSWTACYTGARPYGLLGILAVVSGCVLSVVGLKRLNKT
jgi:hypothetical protein